MGKGTEGQEAQLTRLSFLISCRVAGSPPSLDSSNLATSVVPGEHPWCPPGHEPQSS